MDNATFTILLDYFSFSWSGYQKVRKGVKKRIARHMEQLRCMDMSAYIFQLERNQESRSECEKILSVPVSRFFRDQTLWNALSEKILPRFFENTHLRVWSAGCAGGEEVYSLKIIWEQLGKIRSGLPVLHITASDLNPENLKRAKKGVYHASSFKETLPDIQDRFFEKGLRRKTWAVKPYLKNGIRWDGFHLLNDRPPENAYDIIFLRNNILLYAANDLKLAGFKNVVSALAETGVLIIGRKDTLPKGISEFKPLELPYVFLKKGHNL
jgi:chemotaxis methyl-accepting protein methylase